jgi:DNA (cytosine-5)-methyltransferase 1
VTTSPTSAINVIDLFAGCGGLTQGFHEFRARPDATTSPFRTVGAVELDVAAASTYAANFADEAGGVDHVFAGKDKGDIRNWDPAMLEGVDVDVILGGPPCQGFSGLGKEDANDPRNRLWRDYMRVVQKLDPKIFIMENVEPFRRKPEFQQLKRAADPGGELSDYHLQVEVLNSADYGVPQARRRTIVLATRRDLIDLHPQKQPMRYPLVTHHKRPKNQLALPASDEDPKPWVPVSTIFENTPYDTWTTQLPDRDSAPLGVHLPGPFRTTELHIGRNPTPHSLERYKAIPPGGNRNDLRGRLTTDSWRNHRSGSGDVMGRLRWDDPSVTIRTEFFKPEKGRYLHPFAHRPITHYEAALIQGFPKDYLWCGSKTQIARQIGNAVPVGLSKALAGQVYTYLEEVNQLP